ncbi:MAG TPA: hypothetical protein DEG43_17260 [Acidimicrobiaceae bacterium]|jgi:hypothetical protein|nr:hypothetical protein [Acidimicrobiaceae bacterium]
MARKLRVLSAVSEVEERNVQGAIDVSGYWELIVELRMGAGPTVRIEPGAGASAVFSVTVRWGSEVADVKVRSLRGAIDVADRLANLFYEMRRDDLGVI